MGENLSLMQALYITVASMVMVFLILLLISGVLSLFKHIFKNEENKKSIGFRGGNNTTNNEENNLEIEDKFEDNVEYTLELDEEEKIVVALAASIMAGDGIPNPNLHIKRIIRIS